MSKRNVSIQIIRIFAMFSVIFGCHLICEFNIGFLNKISIVFGYGVYLFLFLSGYLYGKKKIKNIWNWYKERFIKLMIPIYIFLIILFGIKIYQGNFEWKTVLVYLFNLQYFLGTTQGAAHLWFMSVLTISYLITPILEKINECGKYGLANASILIIAIISSFINIRLGRTIFYIFCYALGYIYRNKETKININSVVVIMLMMFALGVRIILQKIIDGTVIYDNVVCSMSNIMVCFGIFYLIRIISKKFQIRGNKFIDYLDRISFYLYITHYMFMVGPLRTMGLTNNVVLNTILTLLSTYISAVLLEKISNNFVELIKR